jgi:arylformamidase
MRIIDITVPTEAGMVVWPGDPAFALRQVSSIDKGQESNISLIRMSVHTGTHIDAPKHFFDSGMTIDQIPLEKLIGEALVLRIDNAIKTITKDVIKEHPLSERIGKVKKILFHTSNSKIWHNNPGDFQHDYVGIDTTGAEYLAQFDLDLVGVDYLSIAPFVETDAPHKILLSKDVVLLEGIDLSLVEEGFYEIYCLPLLLSSSEGAPTRVILVER